MVRSSQEKNLKSQSNDIFETSFLQNNTGVLDMARHRRIDAHRSRHDGFWSGLLNGFWSGLLMGWLFDASVHMLANTRHGPTAALGLGAACLVPVGVVLIGAPALWPLGVAALVLAGVAVVTAVVVASRSSSASAGCAPDAGGSSFSEPVVVMPACCPSGPTRGFGRVSIRRSRRPVVVTSHATGTAPPPVPR